MIARGRVCLSRGRGIGRVPFLLAQRARSECARSTRAIEDRPGYPSERYPIGVVSLRGRKRSALAAGGGGASASAIGWTMAKTGEADGDGGAFAGRAADGNRTAMFFDDLFDRGKTETNPSSLRGEKRLEDLIDDFCWNRSPVVLDENLIFHAAPCTVLGDLNVEMPAGAHRFTCVPENTEKDLLELGLVSSNRGEDRRIVFGYLYPCDLEVGCHDRERALDHFRDTDKPPSQLEWFGKVQYLVQDGFDADQIAHRVLHACRRVEIEDAFTRDFFQLCADRGERLAHFSGEEHTEFPNRSLPFLLSDHGLRWSGGS